MRHTTGMKAGMFVYALAYTSGVVFVQRLACLPDFYSLITLFLSACLFAVACGLAAKYMWPGIIIEFTLIIVCILLFIIGYISTILYAKQELSYRLDENLVGNNLLVSGHVANVPLTVEHIQRFDFDIESYTVITSNNNIIQKSVPYQFPQKLRLSWYYGEPVRAGEHWQFEVRLKPPHGFMNPGGFDYEAWLFQHRIHATGYVRQSALNRRLDGGAVYGFINTVNRSRQSISQQIDALAGNRLHGIGHEAGDIGSFALVKALAIGDKSSISNKQWQVLVNTGTGHLMAISGLHIGLASLFAYALVRRAVPVFIIKRFPAQHIAVISGMIVALLYALFAGLSVSTQRAIIMLSVISVMMLIRRNHRPVDALGFAMLLVLLIDPLAVLSAGFWFSFSAVAVIFISLNSANQAQDAVDSSGPEEDPRVDDQQHTAIKGSLRDRLFSIVKRWIRLQLLISVFLLPLSLFMFQQASLVSPVANFLLIPYVSFIIVPLVLLALVCNLLFPVIAEWLFTLAATLLDFVWPALSFVSTLPSALWIQGNVDVIRLSGATLGILLIFFSGRIVSDKRAKLAGKPRLFMAYLTLLLVAVLMIIPMFITTRPQLRTGEYQLTMLDVGQGSAAVLLTQNHLMVFDTGAKFSNRLDAGRSVVIPYIRSSGYDSVDYLVVSHGDADHIGGAQAILDAYPMTTVIGQDINNLRAKTKLGCFEGDKWQWDGVTFEFLSPPGDDAGLFSSGKRNNHSCVLRVTSTSGAVLFTGDIEAGIEKKLLQKYDEKLPADVLMVPHHGSKTSSSSMFLNTVNPKIALFSVGYKNRYRFPDNKVLHRYSLLDSRQLQSDKAGAVTVRLTGDGSIVVETHREKARKYWHHDAGMKQR